MSVEGYVEDSFDYSAVRKNVLQPLGPGGDRRYAPEIYDHHRGEARTVEFKEAPEEAFLLFEGVMLFRKELVEFFDFRILIMCSTRVILERAKVRDLAHFGDMETLLEKYQKRFIPGQKKYLSENQPAQFADLIFFNDDPDFPSLSVPDGKKG